jgi:hypothetical protein
MMVIRTNPIDFIVLVCLGFDSRREWFRWARAGKDAVDVLTGNRRRDER